MTPSRYELTIKRAVLALAAGEIFGTIILSILGAFPFPSAALRSHGGVDLDWTNFLSAVVSVIPFVAIVFGIGLLIVGVPGWVLLHRNGWRGWRAALAFGFVATAGLDLAAFAVFPVLISVEGTYSASDDGGPTIINGHVTLHGWTEFAEQAITLGAVSAIVGWVIWRIAYRKAASSDTTADAFE
jgi:hypothetical protein